MTKSFYYLSGIPRSGSTVLATIISQNPKIYTTPTSPMLDLVQLTAENWSRVSATQKLHHPDQLKNILHGIFNSSYKHVEQPIILDKHRAWPRNIPLIFNITGRRPKIICTVRDIPEVLASFISILEKNGNSYIDNELRALNKPVTNAARCRQLWEKYVSTPWTSLKLGYETNRDCLHFVDYKEITETPEQAIDGIYKFLELKPFKHKFAELNNPQPENDESYGIKGLHDVRPVLKRISPVPEKIIGPEVVEYYRNLKLEFWKTKPPQA